MLPPEFQFTQANLQDYVDCQRRFQLRHLLELSWPAVEAEPVGVHESHLSEGEAFHRLVHQHQLGLPAELLSRAVAGIAEVSPAAGRLRTWWDNYLRAAPTGLPASRHPEVTLSVPLAGARLAAKFDLVAVEPGRAVIVDWKTSDQRPARGWLASRMQTRVYRYVLARAGDALNAGIRVLAHHIAMLYWFAGFPNQPAHFPYDAAQYAADERFLSSLVDEISSVTENLLNGPQWPPGAPSTSSAPPSGPQWLPLTEDVRRCQFCPYRSLCNRGAEAGQLAAAQHGQLEVDGEPGWGTALDFDQVPEIAFG